MPEIYYQPVDRRRFLRTVTLGGAVWALAGCQSTRRAAAPPGFHLALLSDTHVPGDRVNGHRGFNPWENLRQVVPQVIETSPEGVILCGDAARLEGKPDDYQELKGLLAPLAARAPVYIGLGNHDDRAAFLPVFTDRPGRNAGVDGKHVTIVEHPVVRVVVLDSLLYVNRVAGLLGRNQRQWLTKTLPELRDRPLVLMVHHTLENGDGDLLDAGQLFDLIAGQRHVKAIFYGHSHVWAFGERQGVQLINLPAVGYNFRDQDPVGWVDARFQPDGVSLTLRAIGGNRSGDGQTTWVKWG